MTDGFERRGLTTGYHTIMPPSDVDAYDFLAPPLVRFGAGRLADLGEIVATLGSRAWIVGGPRSLAAGATRERILSSLAAAGIPGEFVAATAGEPTVDQVAAALARLPLAAADGGLAGVVLVACGGGSTIDLAKAIAALAPLLPAVTPAAADLDALVVDHLEGVGRGLQIRHAPLPLVAVPTTAGTGAEATRNAVIACPRRRFKKSMRSPLLVPRAALVDPELTASCDRGTVAAAGLDCVTQLVESFICRFHRPLPRALVLDALPRAVDALPRLLAGGTAAADRSAMSHAALVSGMALANSGLGMAHGVAAALGVALGTPHGLACAVMLPAAMRVNRPAVAADFARLERAVDPGAAADDDIAADAFVERIAALCRTAGVPGRLAELGVDGGLLDWLADNSGGASMRGNPVQLDARSLRAVLASIA